jgi:sugar/nucleoside kinase (ribokinase family)
MTKHSRAAILECLDIIMSYKAFGKVTLGLNENEALLLYQAIAQDVPAELKSVVQTIHAQGMADVVLVHPIHGCYVADENGVRFIDGSFIENPLVTTGGGDHFNAGYGYAVLQGMEIDAAVKFALKVASSFVASGHL